MYSGTIQDLNQEQKYGLIKMETGEEIHFHQYCLWNISFEDLSEGQEVEFEIQSAYRRRLGVHIRAVAKKV